MVLHFSLTLPSKKVGKSALGLIVVRLSFMYSLSNRAVTSSFYHGAHGALLVYDIASKVLPSQKISFNHAFPKKETFKSAKGWLTEIQRYATGEMVTIMVGNKQDLKAKREVPAEKGEVMCTRFLWPDCLCLTL